MKCPSCEDERLVMADRQGVEIDYCPRCRGVWLDRGELDKIIDRAASDLAGVGARRDRDDRRDDRRDDGNRPYVVTQPAPGHGYDPKYKKKKSLLGELFDF